MVKKIISVVLALCIAFGCFSVMASARSVGIGGGAESFNPVAFSQKEDAIGSTRVNATFVATITDKNYKVKINTISSTILYLESGDTSNVMVNHQSGTIVDDVTEFSVTGEIGVNTNSAVRYTVNYDILDSDGNTVWKNLTGYAYGLVSGSTEKTGAIGSDPANPGDIHSGARFTSIDKLNSCYVQVSSAALLYTLKTQHFFFTFKERTSETSVISGNAPSTLRTYPVYWPSVMWYRQESEGTWLMWSTPDSGYYNFTLDMNANNVDWDDESNTVVSTEMYYLDDWDRINARTLSERILGVNGRFEDGFYLQKGRYTEESWNNLLRALDMANQVMLAVPGPNYGFKIACQNGLKADDNLTTAFYNLLEAPCDWTTYKDPIVGEQSTCGSGGTMIYTCICGKTKVEATGTSGCKPADEWTVILEPTCVNKGEEAQLCTMCSNPVNVRNIEPLGHEYETTVVEPLCEEKGYTIYTCVRGDHTYYDNYVDEAGHKSGSAVIENEIPATCLRMGMYESAVYCTKCEEEVSRTIMRTEKVPHVPGEWKVHKEPTVKEAGEEWLYCSVCGYEYEKREIPATGPYFRAARGSETVVDKERGIIYGLPEYLTDLEGYVEYDGGTVEYIETENGFGTGTTVNFVVEGEINQSYKIVIYGDLNGDGVIDEGDIEVYEALINFEISFEEGSAFDYASDLFFYEGVADTYDLAHLYSVISGEGLIFQDPATDDLTIIDETLTGNISVATVVSDDKVERGEMITVTVKLTSSDYISNIQIPVIFDKTKLGYMGDECLTFTEDSVFADKNYTFLGGADKGNGFEKTSNDDKWNTDEAKNKYGYAYLTATYNEAIGSEDSVYALAQGEGFARFQLEALADIEDVTELVFVDADWAKTSDNIDGLLVAGLKKAETYDPYEPVVHYDNITFIIPSTVSEAKQHVKGEITIENNIDATCTTDGSYDEVVYCTECGEELSRETVIVTALGHVESDPVRENEIPAIGSENASYDEVIYCSVCGEELSREHIVVEGVNVTGTVKSFNDRIDNSDVVTIEFYVNVQDEPVYVFEVEGTGVVEYEFNDVNPGAYTVKVSKISHATRTYNNVTVDENGIKGDNLTDGNFVIQLIGDVNGDGNVNTVDVARINAHAKHVSTIVGYNMVCADVTGDGRVNTVDVAKVNAHAKNVSSIW